jgi:hypothetical protein
MGVMKRDAWRDFRDKDKVPQGAVLMISMGKALDKFEKEKDKDLEKALTALEKTVAGYIKSITKKYPAFATKMKHRFDGDIKAERTQAEVAEAKAKLKDTSLNKVSDDRLEQQQSRKAAIAIATMKKTLTALKGDLAAALADFTNDAKRGVAMQKARAINANLATLVEEDEYKDLDGIRERFQRNSRPADWQGDTFDPVKLKGIIKEILEDIRFLERRFR